MQLSDKRIGFVLISCAILLLGILTLVKMDVDEQSAALCDQYHKNQEDMTLCPVHTSNTSWFILFLYGMGFVMLAVGIIASVTQHTKKQEEKQENVVVKKIDESTLQDTEKKIYELLKNHEGSAYQSDLIKETGWSKVAMTRVLDKMELNHLIERKRRGMTNIIVLR